MKKLTALVLILALTLSGCASSGVTDLTADVPARVVCLAEQPDCDAEAADFAVRLFQSSLEAGKNTLVSPLSVLSALAMTANGAKGETLAQMEAALDMTVADMNAWLYSFLDGQTGEMKLANSIWFTDDGNFSVNPDFLETNANYYQADIYKASFSQETCDAINNWVSEKTDEMIPEILDAVPEDAVMYLVNALVFEAEWTETYRENNVREDIFTKEDGTEQAVTLMHSTEYQYLEDENATGFLKYYKGGDYAFAALLPNEGITVADYAASLTGEHLYEMLSQPEDVKVLASLPKFEAEYDAEMSGILGSMGMTDAFDPDNADFSGLGTYADRSIYISRVLHKTYISVAEQGTRAGAATVVEMIAGASYVEEYKAVTLDRPFLYMLIDCESNLPFFIGTLMDVEG